MSQNASSKKEANGEMKVEPVKKAERLTSFFSSSRDLSLRTTNQRAHNNRTAIPNLNCVRNKNSDRTVDGENNRKDQKSERGRNRGRGGKNNNVNNRSKTSNLVQSAGLFSEGIAAVPVNRRSEYHGGSSRGSGAVEELQKPRVVKRDQKPDKAELDSEQKKLTDLLGGDDELDLDDDSKTSSSDDFLPIKIRDPCKRSVANKMLETDVKIKIEPIDGDVAMDVSDSPENSQFLNSMTIKTEPGLEVKSEAFHRMDKLFEASPSGFMLFQLPDTLPGRAPDLPTPSTEPATSSKSDNPNFCSLEHLEEGHVGKLVRYRSGKTKLVLGDTVYDVDVGLTSDFTQHAASIIANSAERSANVYSLGQINAKFNVTPDWMHLFHKMTP